jgi:hypothetical protein
MAQQMAYNPYATQGASLPMNGSGPQTSQNPFMNQQDEKKSFSIPTWLFWLIILCFLGFASWLVWFIYFK